MPAVAATAAAGRIQKEDTDPRQCSPRSLSVGFWRNTRISGKNARYVGPNLNLFGIKCRADYCRSVVRAAAAERRRDAVRGRADEAGDDRDGSVPHPRHQLLVHALAGELRDRGRVAKGVVGDDEALRRERLGGHAAGLQHRCDDRRGDPLAV